MKRSGEWIPFGGTKFLRKLVIYDDMVLGHDLPDVLHATAAPFGGPIAIINGNTPTVVDVSNAAGIPLFTAPLPSDAGSVKALGWTHEETLVVLTNKPACLVWVASRRSFHSVKLPRTLSPADLSLAVIRLTCAIFCGCGSMIVVMFREKKEPEVHEFEISTIQEATCADIINSEFNSELGDVLLVGGTSVSAKGIRKHSLIALQVVDSSVTELEASFPAAVTQLTVSPAGTHIAFALANGHIAVCPSDMSKVLKLIDPNVKKAPEQLQWCGSQYLHLLYNTSQFSDDPYQIGHLSILIPALEKAVHKELLRWDLEGSGLILVTSEVDGLRIISEQANYLIEVVPDCLVDIYSHGSKSVAAALCSASALAATGTIEGIAALRNLAEKSKDLYETLDAIVEAAASEFTVEAQERLLSVVAVTKSHGRIKYDTDAYVDVCRRLKLFNNIRNRDNCAVPISQQQYRYLSGSDEPLRQLHGREAQVLVDRLVQRQDFQWAVNIATYFGSKIDKVLIQWSVGRVIASTDEAEAHADIVSVFRRCPGAGFTEAALEAAALGKQRLAVQLIDSEPRSQSQVLLLLQMGLDEIAMEKAVASSDADLTYLVLLKLMHHMPEPQFFAALNRFDSARMQFLAAAGLSPNLASKALRYLIDAHTERHVAATKLAAIFQPEEATPAECTEGEPDPYFVDSDPEAHRRAIAGTQKVTPEFMTQVEALYQANEATRDEARLCAIHRDLLKEQDKIMGETGDSTVYNLSVTDTIKSCFARGQEDQAEALRKQFNVPEKKFWFTKLLALCESGQWEAIEKMGGIGRYKAVKSPIGFLPFVETLHQHNQNEKGAAFVPKLPTVVQRVEWYVKLDEFQKAVDDAYNDENIGLLEQIRKRAHNPSILQYIDERLKALK